MKGVNSTHQWTCTEGAVTSSGERKQRVETNKEVCMRGSFRLSVVVSGNVVGNHTGELRLHHKPHQRFL